MKHFYLKFILPCLIFFLANMGVYCATLQDNRAFAKPHKAPANIKRVQNLATGDLFQVSTIEGINILLSVVDSELKTCQVGGAVPNQEGYYYMAVEEGTVGPVTIPETANGYKVVGIDVIAFQNLQFVTDIIIPEGVETIGYGAFYNCAGLTHINIPKSLASLGDQAFHGCSSLKKVTINNNSIVSQQYTSSGGLRTIFGNQVQEYVLGEEVKSIGDNAFRSCSELTDISLPNDLTSIGEYCFEGCEQLKSIIIPENVTSIGKHTFGNCSNLSSVNLPNNLISISDFIFWYCIRLSSITIPNSVTSIGEYNQEIKGETNVEIIPVSA